MVVKFTMQGLRVRNITNLRWSWLNKSRLAKRHRAIAKNEALAAGVRGMQPPLTVKLTRVGVGKMDSDGVVASMKAIRDGIADALGIDDGSDLVRWEYDQRKGEPRQYAVEVCLEVVK